MTWAAVAITAIVVGGGIQAYGQYQANKSAQAQAKAQSAWNLYNSKVALREKEAEEAATKFAVKQQQRRGKRLRGKAKAIRGASGVELEGSPLLVMEDTAAELAKEEVGIRVTGQRRAQAFQSRSILDISKASAARARAAGFGQAAITQPGATLLQAGGQAAFVGATT